MAFRISATTTTDVDILDALRDEAWRRHVSVSQAIREAFELYTQPKELTP